MYKSHHKSVLGCHRLVVWKSHLEHLGLIELLWFNFCGVNNVDNYVFYALGYRLKVSTKRVKSLSVILRVQNSVLNSTQYVVSCQLAEKLTVHQLLM